MEQIDTEELITGHTLQHSIRGHFVRKKSLHISHLWQIARDFYLLSMGQANEGKEEQIKKLQSQPDHGYLPHTTVCMCMYVRTYDGLRG